MALHGKPIDAYRLFFPLGIVLGTFGVAIWPLYNYGVLAGFSGRAHAFVQTNGFLYAFMLGFLLTAIPRFTGTDPPSRPVQYVLAAIVTVSALAFELQVPLVGHTGFVVAHVMLLVLAGRRFRRRRQDPPETFVLIGIAFISGAIGGLINAGVAWNAVGPVWDLLGKRLLTEGMMLLLVLGVGGFLGPRLLGFAALPQFDGTAEFRARNRKPVYAAVGFTVLLSLVGEYGFGYAWMALVRAAAATASILATVRPWKRPAIRTTLAWCVWTAHWQVIAALWLVATFPRYRIDFLHVLFIGGFTLLILAVGTRVTLSHGGHSLAVERGSWPLRVGLTTGLAAMLARVGAPFSPNSYFDHLSWAGLLWLTGMLFWGSQLFRLIRLRAVPRT